MTKNTYLIILLNVFILTSAILIALAFYKDWFESYLSVNNPVSPELLIVEGWVSDSTISLAAKEYQDKKYSGIFTSGSPIDSAYLLSENGFLDFNFSSQTVLLQKNDTLSFVLKGSPVQGIYPEYLVFINDQKIAGGITSDSWKTYQHILDSSFFAERISISFINDEHYLGEDRNMEVKCLDLQNSHYPARSKDVLHYRSSDYQRKHPILTNFASIAEICAHKLHLEGIPEQAIEVVASPVSDKNRTLASAIVISNYLEEHNLPYASINILSEGIHARRSWISYKFAFRKQPKEVGIICIRSNRSYNTGLQFYSKKEIIKELVGIVYYKLFFNKRRYREELIQNLPPA